MFLCVRCYGSRVVKDGLIGDRQRFACLDCGRRSVVGLPSEVVAAAKDSAVREVAAGFVKAGVAVALVAKVTGIPRRSVQKYKKRRMGASFLVG